MNVFNIMDTNSIITNTKIINITNKATFFHINFVLSLVKLIKYIFSTVNECSPNLCSGPVPNINMSFPLLSICGEEFISAPKIITFLPYPPPENEKLPFPSNAIPYPEYLY